jgi:pyruvate formate lyase activating enzyme
MSHEAKFYKKDAVNKVRCLLCPHRCLISNHKTGICQARRNEDGVLYAETYGELTSYAMDPVEKKPLYHFLPGTELFSIGSYGCNFKCTFCQNWQISQHKVATEHFEKEDIVRITGENGASGIAYTYNEPFIWHEFVFDTAKLAREKSLKNVLVTNGYVSEEPLREILPLIDAMNIDLKSLSESFYREVCGGQLEPVLRTIKLAYEAGVHVELTTLVIPGLNDGEDIEKITDWVAGISTDIPLHFSRYFPHYKMNLAPTDLEVLHNAYETGRKKLKYVYLGNVATDQGGCDTICPGCGSAVIKRDFIAIDTSGLFDGRCKKCNARIAGVF